MYTVKTFRKRWTDRRVLKKVDRTFRMWYGITTNIISAEYLPKDITEGMFIVLSEDIKNFLKEEMKYLPVESEENAKMAAILFEENNGNLVLGFQIFVKQGKNEWFTRVGNKQSLIKVETLQVTEQVEYHSISTEWIEQFNKTITGSQRGRLTMKQVNPRRTKILYFA